jgi:hypothetical protein
MKSIAALVLLMSAAIAQSPDTSAAELSADSSGAAAENGDKDTVYVLQGDRDEEKKSELRMHVEAIKDTVLVLTREGAKDLLGDLREERRTARERGFGGALGVAPGVFAVSMKPVDELVGKYGSLRDVGFDIDDGYDMFVMIGGLGYAGLGNGLRIGGGGRGGSKEFTRIKRDTAGTTDITHTADIAIGYGGFLIEKARVAGNFNLLLGAMFGGGSMSFKLRSTVGDPFSTAGTTDSLLPEGTADASFLLIEAHGGITYSLLSWLHIGADISAPLFISASGFRAANQGGITDGFVTVNPGLRLRIMLGNIG